MHTVNTYVQNLLSKYQKALEVSCHFLSKNRKQSLVFPQTSRGWISMPFHSGSMLYLQRTTKEKLIYCERDSVPGFLDLLIPNNLDFPTLEKSNGITWSGMHVREHA